MGEGPGINYFEVHALFRYSCKNRQVIGLPRGLLTHQKSMIRNKVEDSLQFETRPRDYKNNFMISSAKLS